MLLGDPKANARSSRPRAASPAEAEMGSCRDRTASPAEAEMGSCRERTASPAQAEMGSYRYRGLAGYSPNWYRIVTDGGEGGREGGMDLSNRSMPAPCRNTGDRSNRRGSVPSTCLPALSADDDYLGMSDMGQTPTPFEEEEEAEEKRPVIVRPGEQKRSCHAVASSG
ncbi:unnamed protein product [Peronospora farinosa]|uniref:Uncharacterized protein n=1 Tax=Peronospora farinosa TaxID=134698 RepID=A0AAV0U0L6_9STRA|nr:unnamed protein product [Peronospora farinosa]